MKPLSPEQIKALTKEKKLAYLDALAEYKRRKKLKGRAYKPNEAQLATHVCDKDIIVNLSGNGCGKTASLCAEAWWAASGYHPYLKRYFKMPGKVTVVLDHPDKVADKWLPELKKFHGLTDEMCHKLGKPYVTSVRPPGVSEISFMFHQQDPLTFESTEGEVYLFDEPPPRWLFFALIRGAREKGIKIRIIVAGTPLTGGWLRKDIVKPWQRGERPDVEVLQFSSDVNKENLDWEFQLRYFSMLTEKEQQTRRHGNFFDAEGLALAGVFNPDVHIVEDMEFKKEWPCVVAIDPHPSKKTHCVLLGVDPEDRLYVVKEFAQKLVARDFAKVIAKKFAGFRVIDVVVDSLGSQDGTGGEGFDSFIKVCNDEWKKTEGCRLRARATTYKEKLDESFIERIQTALLIPDNGDPPILRIFPECVGLISDIDNAEWLRDKVNDMNKPKLNITNKDFLSCLKYGLATGLFFAKADLTSLQRPLPATYVGTAVKRRSRRLTLAEWLKS